MARYGVEETRDEVGPVFKIVDHHTGDWVGESHPTRDFADEEARRLNKDLTPYGDRTCDLCGELLAGEEDIGEMHGSGQYKHGVLQNGLITEGLVHAQCGLDAGWEVS